MNIVELENVTRVYPKNVTALRGVTLALPERTVCGLVGRNGAGKTTLLRMIPALLHPTEGTVRVFGLDPVEAQEDVKKGHRLSLRKRDLPLTVRIKDMTDLCASIYPRWEPRDGGGPHGALRPRPAAQRSPPSPRVSSGRSACSAPLCISRDCSSLDEPAGGLDPVARREFLEVVINLLARCRLHGALLLHI